MDTTEQELPFDDSFETQIVPMADMKALIEASRAPCSNGNPCGSLLPHRICARKIGVLCKLARLNATGDEWVRVETGWQMIGHSTHRAVKTAYRPDQHTYRLQWFGMVQTLEHRSALWQIINPRAILFLRGELSVPKRILVNHGNVHYASAEQVFVKDSMDDLDKDYWDNYRLDVCDAE